MSQIITGIDMHFVVVDCSRDILANDKRWWTCVLRVKLNQMKENDGKSQEKLSRFVSPHQSTAFPLNNNNNNRHATKEHANYGTMVVSIVDFLNYAKIQHFSLTVNELQQHTNNIAGMSTNKWVSTLAMKLQAMRHARWNKWILRKNHNMMF